MNLIPAAGFGVVLPTWVYPVVIVVALGFIVFGFVQNSKAKKKKAAKDANRR